MKKSVFCIFFLIFLTLITCSILAETIEEEMTLEVIGYKKQTSYDSFSMPKEMHFYDEEGAHLYEVYEGTGWESGMRAREIPLTDGYFVVDRDYIVVRSASRQPVEGELADLYDGTDMAPSRYVAYYPDGIPPENPLLFQAEILEQSDHVLLLYKENGIQPFTENRAKFGMIQLTANNWRVYSLDALEQLLENVPDSLTAIVLVAAIAMLGINTCILVYHADRNKWLLIFNGIAIGILLILLRQILNRIDLPASMLPPENIFNISYYRAELAEIFSALEELASGTTRTYVELQETVLRKGCGTLIWGGAVITAVTVLELVSSWHLARKNA